MLAKSISLVLVTVMFLMTVPYQTMQGSLQINQVLASKNDTLLTNGTDDKTQIMIDELRKSRTLLEVSAPRQVVLSIVSFFVAMAFTIFGIQLAFRPQKTEIKYFTVAILSLIIPVTVLLITFVASNVLGIQSFGLISRNVWLFASVMLLIPIFTLIILVILHRIRRERL
ncbi:MAG: hypothetical protein QOA19_09235 [Nitrososphaeraceae archaeon]|jgi:hypothetical protein|nr:hypothetical protein [Nitrososphaeraceae archaeon]MDW0169586.1 hypothetical protein [Nitrososphaeraceae archaeon]MDW0171264.1 hypothetical protein [Nitrososphaeraceae archaeon]MDW0176327.1 hypothetical protein [Nitrososphaeraceae archaeon]MDW0178507.1 hypothetical protein [Nitrososphaeraceae archaeon]